MGDEPGELTRERDYWRGIVRTIGDVIGDGEAIISMEAATRRYRQISAIVTDAIAGDC